MSGGCYTLDDVVELLYDLDYSSQIEAFKKIQTYVLVTVFVLLFQLGHLLKPFAYRVFRILSWASYLLVPVLISYILGLMGRSAGIFPKKLKYAFGDTTVTTFRYLTCVWSIFLLFAYAGFDNLNAFSLEERHGRSKLVIQVGIQFSLLLLIIYQIPAGINVIALSCAFIVLAFKFAGRLLALAHSAGATPRIKKDVTRIINYSNRDDDDDDDTTDAGSDYLVGPKYTKLKDERIVEGITMEKIWRSEGRLLKFDQGNMELKDTCLSFALFWLLLGKFWSYPLYGGEDGNKSSSKAKAWRLVRHGLLAKEGEHERVFRVIEIELAFLRDYFHARYIFFYLNGFYWKLISVVALPAMFWFFIQKAVDQTELDALTKAGYGDFGFTKTANNIVITVIVALEVIQLVIFLTSRWLKVTLLCFYVKKTAATNTGCLSRFFLELLGRVFLGSSRSSNSAWWRKPWKRELDQYSLVQSCTTVPKPTSFLALHFISIFGLPFSKPERKQGKAVALSDQVKKAVVLCLQRYDAECPKLSSLRRNGFMKILPAWDCKLKNDTETILVWHIATSVCELRTTTSTTTTTANTDAAQSTYVDDMKVATELSKYCAYLLFFAPSLLTVPSLVAETVCDTVVKEAMTLFDTSVFSRGGKIEDAAKYKKLENLIRSNDEEAGDKGSGKGVLEKGAKLGGDLVTLVKDDKERWKILAEFWVEMILYLAPSNNNELAHAGKLGQGGEFITQLWALLIHAGIYDRDDLNA